MRLKTTRFDLSGRINLPTTTLLQTPTEGLIVTSTCPLSDALSSNSDPDRC